MTAQQDLLDATIRHQIGIRNFTSGEVRRVLTLLESVDRDLTRKLRERLAGIERPVDFTSDAWRALLADVRQLRAVGMQRLRQQLTPTLTELAKVEADFEGRIAQASIPVELQFAAVDARQLRALVFQKPFEGRLLRQWYQSLAAADQRRLETALQLGIAQGESIQQITRRVAGTRARGFTDGALATTRRNAEAVVRTAVNHVSNSAREAFWLENPEFVSGMMWVSTLDGRTTPVCQARDGKVGPIGGKPLPDDLPAARRLVPANARPPAHVACRSLMVAVLDGVGIVGRRPVVTDTRTRQRREIDFRAEARRTGRPIREIRREWAVQNVGTVPAKTTYDEFLRRQTTSFQDEVLGPTRGRLFRAGETVDQFVDRAGNELTLDELAKTDPASFVSAGLDPKDF